LIRQVGITEQTLYRWKKQYKGPVRNHTQLCADLGEQVKIAGEMTQFFKVLAVLVLNLLVALLLVGPWIGLSHIQNRYDLDSRAVSFLEAISRSNLFDAVLALLFVFLATLLLIHRLLWPLLTRSLFRMRDIGTKGRCGVLVAVGLTLLEWSVVNLPDLLKELVKVPGG
jgi:hypothetical protein